MVLIKHQLKVLSPKRGLQASTAAAENLTACELGDGLGPLGHSVLCKLSAQRANTSQFGRGPTPEVFATLKQGVEAQRSV